MSIKIQLRFQTSIDLESLQKGIHVRLIRLITFVQLKTPNGWTSKQRAIIDTGNPICVVPSFVWSHVPVEWLLSDKAKLRGIGSGEISGRLGKTTMILADQERISPSIEIKALLLDDDSVPFLIGFEDVLTGAKLVSDYKSKIAYLEWE